VREDESLEIRHATRNAIGRQRTSTNQFEIAIKDTREIADLKNAGLNPILSAKNSGAPTGAGAMAQAPDYAKA
jgi:hypothetical protein